MRSRVFLFACLIPLALNSAPRTYLQRTPGGLAFERLPDGALAARQGRHRLTLEAGRITVALSSAGGSRSATVTTKLVGATARAPQGIEPLAAVANYLLGSDPSAWRTGAPLFSKAAYRGVYPGIDLVFHGRNGQLEYDFVARAGASVKNIALAISGAERTRLDPNGDLVLETAAGEIRWKRPVAYQMKNGARQPVASAFVLRGHEVRFQLGDYDPSRDLVVDPALAYATYQGGNDNDSARGVAVDSAGNIYVTGYSLSMNLPHTGGSFQPGYKGGSMSAAFGGDAFVAKYTSAGALVYVTYIGGSDDDVADAIAVDSSGYAYITGYTQSTDFPVTAGVLQARFGGGAAKNYSGANGDAFVTKLNPTGTALVYSTYLGGNSSDIGAAIAVDSTGSAYVGGSTLSTNFPVVNAAQGAFAGAGGNPSLCDGCSGPLIDTGDGFVSKLNPAGTALVWSTYLGGSLDDAVTALAIDSSNSTYVGGATLSSNFPTKNPFQSKYGGTLSDDAQPVIKMGDGFIAKYDANGTQVYSTYLGGSGDDAVMGIAVDSAGAAYAAGFTSSANLAPSSVLHGSLKGPATITGERGFTWGDAFVAKLAAAGNSLVYATYLGGSADDAAMSVAVDSAGDAIVGGFTNSTDWPVTANAVQSKYGGTRAGGEFTDDTGDAFLAELSADGSTTLYNSYYGGAYDDAITGVAVTSNGNIAAVGSTTSRNLPLTSNAAQPAFGGEDSGYTTEVCGDAFVAIFSGIASTSGGSGGTTGGATPVITSVQNGASFANGFPSGAWMTIKGTNLAAAGVFDTWANVIVNSQLPTTLDNVSVTVAGQPAYVYFVSPGQINVVAPNVAAGSTSVVVKNSLGASAAFQTTSNAYQPAFFQWSNTSYAVATRQDFSDAAANGTIPGLTTVAAKPGDVIILWGTGFGPTSPSAPSGVQTPVSAYNTASAVTVMLGSTPATVYGAALAPGFAALYQVAIQVPSGLANGDYPVVATVNGVSSPPATLLTVQQ